MGTRVFISHSAKDALARQFLDDLAEALRDAEYLVMLDKDELALGVEWRSTLNMWIGSCDVAIVLLSEDALTSRFVEYETDVLTYRKDQDFSFELFPIVLRPVTERRVEESPLGTTMITRWQSAIQEVGGDAIAKVLEKLQTLKPKATPLEKPAQRVQEILRRAAVSPARMQTHLEHLGVELPPWIPSENLVATLAASMLAKGLEASVPFIRSIRTQMDPREVQDLIELLASSWVDYASITKIPGAARDQRVIATNADDPVIARMYVIRAAIEEHQLPPHDSWVIADVDAIPMPLDDHSELDGPVTAAIAASGVQEQVLSRLAAKFCADPDDVHYELEMKRKGGEPVFVALPARSLTFPILSQLLGAFDGVAFFLLMGTGQPGDDLADLAVFLKPRLAEGQEQLFLRQYANRDYLLQGLRS